MRASHGSRHLQRKMWLLVSLGRWVCISCGHMDIPVHNTLTCSHPNFDKTLYGSVYGGDLHGSILLYRFLHRFSGKRAASKAWFRPTSLRSCWKEREKKWHLCKATSKQTIMILCSKVQLLSVSVDTKTNSSLSYLELLREEVIGVCLKFTEMSFEVSCFDGANKTHTDTICFSKKNHLHFQMFLHINEEENAYLDRRRLLQ